MPDDEDQLTTLAARVPVSLRERIRQAAQKEERSESGFLRFHLGRIAEEVISKDQPSVETECHGH